MSDRAGGALTPRVLVVDDDAAIGELLVTVLTRDGCAVDTERDPTRAEALRARRITLDVLGAQGGGGAWAAVDAEGFCQARQCQ